MNKWGCLCLSIIFSLIVVFAIIGLNKVVYGK